jgi:hypothetical protein
VGKRKKPGTPYPASLRRGEIILINKWRSLVVVQVDVLVGVGVDVDIGVQVGSWCSGRDTG